MTMTKRSINKRVEDCKLEHSAENCRVFIDYLLDGAVVYCKDCCTIYLITEDSIVKYIAVFDINKIANMLRVSEVKRYLFSI